MKLTKKEMKAWVDEYIKAQDNNTSISENGVLHWSVNKFFELENEHPELCWKIILEILHREPSQKVKEMLAAGPLEDLIDLHGEEYIEVIEEEAKINPEFRKLLRGVWESSTPEIWNRVLKARMNTNSD
ncbi:hypothetical protein CW740_00140 [Kangiella profundi]|uniref:DUF6869 domain-containing protein n=1 Tax=Kangiella profundi TaxID=1561924 RepID=A0A2K9A8I8_9GAMM|nr:hypothetical protein [Kangiella profundi]AUD77727.1 hypothetical protein CW740_00140 [Kangiella profundi]GGE93169.1 hypothetical protein GCM10011356_04010 [Kangiella profundi]